VGRLERFAPAIAAVMAGSILLGCGFGQEAQSSPPATTPPANAAPDVPDLMPPGAGASSTAQDPSTACEPCASGAASDSATTSLGVDTDIPQGSGVLVGRVERSGVDPRSGGGGDEVTSPVSGDPIEIRDADGTVVARPVSAEDGTFQVTLPVALYTVTEDILGITQCAAVRNQAISTITFVLSEPSGGSSPREDHY
jgi:hypothetical protein